MFEKPFTKLTKREKIQINEIRKKKKTLQQTLRNQEDKHKKTHIPPNWKNIKQVDVFLDLYALLKINQDEINNLNKFITFNEIQTIIKKSPNEIEGYRWSQPRILPNFQRRIYSNPPQIILQNGM